jgi:putative ABC transport system substrate-binding protein
LENAFRIAGKDTDGLIVVGAAWLNNHRTQIIDLAAKTRLPIMYTQRQFVVEGGLMSYSADLFEQARHAAILCLIGFWKALSPPIYLWSSRRSLS